MEEPLKARLIGASILVVLAVALVPELLSGPKNAITGGAAPGSTKGTRTVTIDLGGAGAAGTRIEPRPDAQPAGQTPPALPKVESPASQPAAQAMTKPDESAATADTPPEPVPVVTPTATATAKPTPKPVPTTQAPSRTTEAKPSVTEPAVAAAVPVKGGYSVQVGAFGSDATARRLVNELKADGLPAYISPLSKSGKTLHRVRVGPAADKAAADTLAARLKARGLPVSVVAGG